MSEIFQSVVSRRQFIEKGSALAVAAGIPEGRAKQSTETDSMEYRMKYDSRGPLLVSFVGGNEGIWQVEKISSVTGESLPLAKRLAVLSDEERRPSGPSNWTLRGVTSNLRYTNLHESEAMKQRREGLGRPQATRAALIPIRKSNGWWALSQDERREIFEEQSHHISIGIEYLPAISRRLHHSREPGEPFDFLTWFEYAPEHSDDFEMLVNWL